MARIGTSGWTYPHWRHVLYEGVPSARWLERYAAEFDTVELNGSFYRWPSTERFTAWADRVPPGFSIAVKAPRGLSHGKRLADPAVWLDRIRTSTDALGPHRGPLLVQLPPDMARDDARLDSFLDAVPDGLHPVMELRHPSWVDEAVFDILARHDAASCVMSGAGLPCELRATSSLVYARLHGPDPHTLYAGSYSDDDLRWWRDRIREWEGAGHEVRVYFDNDGEGHAVRNARTLREMLASGG
ncbi:MAG: DUF72 domain-containing protein [Microbacterium sp.]|uniref:DUF72 domain-containing protein n=1 Tax=Microbacterium sp. TaxID=51671 RepID=UPI0026101357|nr:DUF72 domain-containing protein [Microbacterium sp.]MCX6501342.1 DUF72 domain-containing protein [Microbacterium sp.]